MLAAASEAAGSCAAARLEAFELRPGKWVLIAAARDDDPIRIPPFDAITFGLGELWP